jgi:hypothetical protein
VTRGSRQGKTPHLGCRCRDRAVIVRQPKSANTAEQIDYTPTHISAPRRAAVYSHHHHAGCIDLYRCHLVHDCASIIQALPRMPAPFIQKGFDRLDCPVDHFGMRFMGRIGLV